MIKKIEFNELKEYWYTQSGTIKLVFTGFYGERYELSLLRERNTIVSFFAKLFKRTVFINRRSVYRHSAQKELKEALTKYLRKMDQKPIPLAQGPNMIDDAKGYNPEFAEYMMTAWDGSQGLLLSQWALNRLNNIKYERPKWVLEKLKQMEEHWASGTLEKPNKFKIDDEMMQGFIKNLQRNGHSELNLNKNHYD